jgi:hypothetical protein
MSSNPDREFVESTVTDMKDKGVIGKENEIDDDVQERLRTLGYVS